MSSNTVLQRKSAMPENMKVASLNQEVIRRMLNTSEDLDDAMRMTVVDNFAKKVRNSGYCIKQTRDIMMGGLKGYERKLNLSRDHSNPKWNPLHEGAKSNVTGRRHKKIMSKSNWFKRSGSNQEEEPARKRGRPQTPNPEEEVRSLK